MAVGSSARAPPASHSATEYSLYSPVICFILFPFRALQIINTEVDDWQSVCVCACTYQDLKGKILLKAKKIGGLEESETLTDEATDEISDEAEPESPSAENLSAEAICLHDKVWGSMDGWR